MEITILTAFTRMIVALVLGAILGIERSVSKKNAGLRTYALVSLGSCLFVLTSLYAINDIGVLTSDPLRLVAGVVTGIGFLGAGLIFRVEERLSGLTTAAGLWMSCGIGIATGFGYYLLAGLASVLTLITFTALWFVEKRVVSASESKKDQVIDSKKD